MPSQETVKQVGGDHYKGDYKHWDLVLEHNISYLEASASKYVSRWRAKGGAQDLLKAISYIDKRIAVVDNPTTGNFTYAPSAEHRLFGVDPLKLRHWFQSAHVGVAEQEICWLLFFWRSTEDLQQARELINFLRENHLMVHRDNMGGLPDSAYTNQG